MVAASRQTHEAVTGTQRFMGLSPNTPGAPERSAHVLYSSPAAADRVLARCRNSKLPRRLKVMTTASSRLQLTEPLRSLHELAWRQRPRAAHTIALQRDDEAENRTDQQGRRQTPAMQINSFAPFTIEKPVQQANLAMNRTNGGRPAMMMRAGERPDRQNASAPGIRRRTGLSGRFLE